MTDKIQGQLIDKSKTEIKQVSNEMVRLLRYFIDEETEKSYNGMPWSSPTGSHQNWNQISDIIFFAINDIAEEVDYDSYALMQLLIENRPIDGLHTHSYGFHTANGRELINGIQNKYYEYENGNY